MTVSDARRHLSASKSIKDLEVGDYVHRSVGSGRSGRVESEPNDGHVWVVWTPERREYLPLAALRKIRPGGHEYDARHL